MSTDLKNLEIETQLVQSLEEFEEGESRTIPLVQSTTFNYTNPDTLAELFELKKIRIFFIQDLVIQLLLLLKIKWLYLKKELEL